MIDPSIRKYIIVDGRAEVFGLEDCHKIVAAGRPVQSAGFFYEMDGVVETFGFSASLDGLATAKGDAGLIRESLTVMLP